jgi:ABC-type transporter Mla subunit MlaD
MSETEAENGIAEATKRFDSALARLDQSIKSLNQRLRQHTRMEVDTQRLVHERARLATELDKTAARAKRLDDSAHDVSRRLVTAMETVRDVLAKAEQD